MYAFSYNAGATLFESIFTSFFQKDNIYVYAPNTEHHPFIEKAPSLQRVQQCQDADILVISEDDIIHEACQRKMVFATTYRMLKQNTNAVGTLYWLKGRPHILFYQQRLDAYHLHLPKRFDDYIE
jgi:hypothetical protein